MLKKGLNMSAVNHRGSTPLMDAVACYSIWITHDEETLKKKLKFVMEHTDFSKVYERRNILTFTDEPRLHYFWKMLWEHLAKLEALEVPVNQAIVKAIKYRGESNGLYKLCQEELLMAKNTKLKFSRVSFFNLLADRDKKLKNYAGNKYLVTDWRKKKCEKNFPIYGALIDVRMRKAIQKRELFDKSCKLLSKCLPIFDCFHLILRDTLDYITSMKDLSKFRD